MTSNIEDVYVFPTTYPQKQIWFLYQLNPESPAYNIPFAYNVEGELNVCAIHKAVNEVIARHETFRTTFVDAEDGLIQVVKPELEIDVPVYDSFKTEDEIKHHIESESIRAFDLTQGPLIRASVINRGNSSYILFINFHHIILDHISVVQFAEELTLLYKTFLSNNVSPLVKPELQYADYSVWQSQHQTHEQLSSKLDFWTEQLKDKIDYLDIPLDKKRPVMQTMEGKELQVSMPLSLLNNLKMLSRKESVSMYITLMSAYSVLLSIYSKQTEVSVGTPFANRSHQPELEKIMGCFINTVPIYTDLSGNPSFNEVLKRVRKMVFAANANQELPFEMIVEALKPKRDTSYNPLFQVGFTFQEPPMEIELEACSVKSQRIHNQSAKFDLLAWLWEAEDGIRGTLEYNTSIFKQSTIERFAKHYSNLLDNVSQNPDTKISELTILTDEERTLFKKWNNTSKDYDSSILLHQKFEKIAKENPQKIAIEFEGDSLSYQQLDEKSTECAKYLISQGVDKESYVGVFMLRSIEMMVAIYGILKAGAAYIPIDPEYPKDRINYIIADANLDFVLTHNEVDSAVLDVKQVINLDELNVENNSLNDLSLPECNSTNTAYVIYTSGTTGRPKGVMISHQSIINRLEWMQDKYKLCESDVILQKTPYAFDVSVWELFWPLMFGAKLQIAKPEGHKDPGYLKDLIKNKNVTTLHFVPSMLRVFLNNETFEDCNELKKVFCSGEALPYDLTQLFFKNCHAELHNLYGPTEAAVDVTYWECKADDTRNFVPIGLPVSNTQLYVLDKNFSRVPIGIVGELHIGGVQVAKGYLNKSELTEEKFITDVFSGNADAKMYRTGDLVKFHETGEIEYIGRNDFQVKVRGFRIELGEIESVLINQDEIKDAVVVVCEPRENDPRLVAYIVVSEGVTLTTTSIRNLIKNDLPDYMLPQHIVMLDEMPLTPNGKADKKALPDAFSNNDFGGHKVVLPNTYATKKLAKIWSEVLDISLEKIGVSDNFFDIGGHSILSMQVIMKIKDVTGVKLNPRVIILETLEHVAEQCGFAEETETIEKQDVVAQKKSLMNKVFGGMFKK